MDKTPDTLSIWVWEPSGHPPQASLLPLWGSQLGAPKRGGS